MTSACTGHAEITLHKCLQAAQDCQSGLGSLRRGDWSGKAVGGCHFRDLPVQFFPGKYMEILFPIISGENMFQWGGRGWYESASRYLSIQKIYWRRYDFFYLLSENAAMWLKTFTVSPEVLFSVEASLSGKLFEYWLNWIAIFPLQTNLPRHSFCHMHTHCPTLHFTK